MMSTQEGKIRDLDGRPGPVSASRAAWSAAGLIAGAQVAQQVVATLVRPKDRDSAALEYEGRGAGISLAKEEVTLRDDRRPRELQDQLERADREAAENRHVLQQLDAPV